MNNGTALCLRFYAGINQGKYLMILPDGKTEVTRNPFVPRPGATVFWTGLAQIPKHFKEMPWIRVVEINWSEATKQ